MLDGCRGAARARAARRHRQPAVPRRRRAASPRASTRAATSTRRRLPSRSTRSRSASHRSRTCREAAAPAARRALLAPARPARGRARPPDRAALAAQGGGRARRREPHARGARGRDRRRHESGQEDFQAFTPSRPAARQVLENLELVLAYELAALARRARCAASTLPPALERAARGARGAVPQVVDDRVLAPDVERRPRAGPLGAISDLVRRRTRGARRRAPRGAARATRSSRSAWRRSGETRGRDADRERGDDRARGVAHRDRRCVQADRRLAVVLGVAALAHAVEDRAQLGEHRSGAARSA